jgi:hypothetical protein
MLQLTLVILFNIFHPFYVSVTEIEQNQKTGKLQVSTRIFYDDLEKALDKRYKTNINILKPVNKQQVDALISGYVKEHLKIKADNKEMLLKYVGYEIEEEAAWCYFETDKTDPVRNLYIQNNILFEQHESQVNMIHALVTGKRQSSKLDNPKDKVNFSW